MADHLFRLPSLGSDMDVGTVIEWLVNVGDTVHRGDVLLRVDTDKSDIDVETWDDGVVAELLVEPGAEIPVGTPIARLSPLSASGEEPTSEAPPAEPSSEPPVARETPAVAPALRFTEPTQNEPAAPSPTAAEPFVTPRTVYWPAPASSEARAVASPTPGQSEKPDSRDRMRQAVARLMTTANREIPHYHLRHQIDLATATNWIEDHNAKQSPGDRLVMAALLLRAVALACKKHPELNGHWIDGQFEPSPEVTIGMAMHLRGGGLVTPSLPAVDTLDVTTLMKNLKDLTGRAKGRSLRSTDVAEASITVTSLGANGVDAVLGVIHPPQVALVGFGGIRKAPVAVDGSIEVHPVIDATLSADHRATDGQSGSVFLATIDHLLQNPETLQSPILSKDDGPKE